MVKIGLLRRIDVVQVVAELMRKYRPKYIVYAPVLHSTRGDLLVAPQVYSAIKEQLIPLCTIVLEPSDLPSGTRQPISAVANPSTRRCSMPAVTSA